MLELYTLFDRHLHYVMLFLLNQILSDIYPATRANYMLHHCNTLQCNHNILLSAWLNNTITCYYLYCGGCVFC